MEIELRSIKTSGASVNQTGNSWRLEIPAGNRGTYRLAQLDDYRPLARKRFLHTPPCSFHLRARVSASNLPGTWGFGLWNDPFGFSLGLGGETKRLPVLPNAAWFFHASHPNWLSFRTGIPAHGFFAGSIRSPHIPSLLLAPGVLVTPFLAIRPVSRLLRQLVNRLIRQDAAAIYSDITQWHEYSIHWLRESTEFRMDGNLVLRTTTSPVPPLGVVLWIDNQFAAWTPEGSLGYGTLDNPAVWLEIDSLKKIS